MNFAARQLNLNLLPICVTRGSNLISLRLGLIPSSSIGLLARVNEAMLLKCLPSTWPSRRSISSRHCCYFCQYISGLPNPWVSTPLESRLYTALYVVLEDRGRRVIQQLFMEQCLCACHYAQHTVGTRTDRILAFMELTIQWGRQMNDKSVITSGCSEGNQKVA